MLDTNDMPLGDYIKSVQDRLAHDQDLVATVRDQYYLVGSLLETRKSLAYHQGQESLILSLIDERGIELKEMILKSSFAPGAGVSDTEVGPNA